MYKSKEENEREFYSKRLILSFSGMSKLLFEPEVYYERYVIKTETYKESKATIEGNLKHVLLLEPESFDKLIGIAPNFKIQDYEKTLIDALVENNLTKNDADKKESLSDFAEEILEYLKLINKHQSLKNDESRLNKFITENTNRYFKAKTELNGKLIVTEDQYNSAKKTIDFIRKDSFLSDLLKLGVKSTSSLIVKNEEPLFKQFPLGSFDLRGIVDNYVIDRVNRKVFINDFKTTGKPLEKFKNSVEYDFHYWLQCPIYIDLVKAYIKNELNDDPESYEYEFHFIVVDPKNRIYPFPVSKESLNRWTIRYQESLAQAEYHYINKDFTLPYNYARKLVKL